MHQNIMLRKKIVEQAILRNGITRNEIADLTDTRLATVGDTVKSLLAEGLIDEPERSGGGSIGRRASPLCIRGEYGCFLGIALEFDHMKIILIDAAGKQAVSASTFKISASTPEAVFQLILDALADMQKQSGNTLWGKILAAGFADPGLVNEKTGESIKAVNFPGWENIETAQRLEKALNCPVFVRPEMAARAYAERLIDGMIDERGCFHLNLGCGVGGAYTRNIEVFVGDSFCQMEIGHIIVEENGTLCQCGNHGCLEALVGRDGLARRVDQLKQNLVDSTLVNREFSLAYFVEAVREGDKAAMRLAIETAQQIGKALSVATALLNPSSISLSGSLFSLQDIILPVLRQTLTLRCLPQAIAGLDWKISSLGDDAPALGSALIARHAFLVNRAELSKPSKKQGSD